MSPRYWRHVKKLFTYGTLIPVFILLYSFSFSYVKFGSELIALLSLSIASISIVLSISSYTRPTQWYPEDVRYAIMESEISDWEYRESLREQKEKMVLKSNRNISIEIRLETKTGFSENWTENYMSDDHYRYRVLILHSGREYKDTYLISVDGNREYVPMPQSQNDLTISPFEDKIARIANCSPASGLARDISAYEREYESKLGIAGIEVR